MTMGKFNLKEDMSFALNPLENWSDTIEEKILLNMLHSFQNIYICVLRLA